MPGIVYRMIGDYEPQVDGCMQCSKNDGIYVQKPYMFDFQSDGGSSEQGSDEHPTGWLYGFNMETNQTGYIPAEYVEFVEYISRPDSRTSRTSSVSMQPNLAPVQEDPGQMTPNHVFDETTRFQNYVPVTLGGGQFQNFSQSSTDGEALEDQPWYWGTVSKDDVNNALKNEIDGTFLVRNSQPAGCYTLTLRKNGGNKLIKIYQDGGKFGFSAPYHFDSVISLIDYYRRESLAVYNTDLDITLRRPMHRPMISAQKKQDILNNLAVVENELHELNEKYEQLWTDYDEIEKELRQHKTSMDSFRATLQMMEASKPILEMNREKLGGGKEHQRILINQRQKQERIQVIILRASNVESKYKRALRRHRDIEGLLTEYKERIIRHKKSKEAKIDYLRARNVTDWEIENVLLHDDERDDGSMYYNPDDLRRKFPDHCIQEYWYYPKYTRDQAIRVLTGRPNGTFLIRDRCRVDANHPPHACSLVVNGEVHHCLIQKTRDGYGFAEPFNLHSSLKDLVLHYARNPLTPHNEMLTTTLAIPLAM